MLPKNIDELMEYLNSEKEVEILASKLVQAYIYENEMKKIVSSE